MQALNLQIRSDPIRLSARAVGRCIIIAMNRIERLAAVLLLLQERPHTSDEIARRFEVSRRTILRDVQALSEMGVPVIAREGPGGGYSLASDYHTEPLPLTRNEAFLLLLALDALRRLSDLPFKREMASLETKLRALLPQGELSGAHDLLANIGVDVPVRKQRAPFSKTCWMRPSPLAGCVWYTTLPSAPPRSTSCLAKFTPRMGCGTAWPMPTSAAKTAPTASTAYRPSKRLLPVFIPDRPIRRLLTITLLILKFAPVSHHAGRTWSKPMRTSAARCSASPDKAPSYPCAARLVSWIGMRVIYRSGCRGGGSCTCRTAPEDGAAWAAVARSISEMVTHCCHHSPGILITNQHQLEDTMQSQAFERAQEFIWRDARLIDRYLFSHLFCQGPKTAVITALKAYQNPDGGFGNALEPDKRAPTSQPIDAETALRCLDTIDALSDAQVQHELLLPLCGWLQRATTPEGGIPFVLPSSNAYPHTPWMGTSDDHPPAAINPTASVAGYLLKSGLQHAWIDRAVEYCWQNIEASVDEEYHTDHDRGCILAECARPEPGSRFAGAAYPTRTPTGRRRTRPRCGRLRAHAAGLGRPARQPFQRSI